MINTIGGVVVLVSNQKEAVEFYRDKLGFDLRIDLPVGEMHWVEVTPKDSQSSISLVEPSEKMMPKEEVEKARKSIGSHTGIWFYTKDIQSTYEQLRENGVEISKPEKQDWGGVMSTLKDQDGNIFNLVEFKM